MKIIAKISSVGIDGDSVSISVIASTDSYYCASINVRLPVIIMNESASIFNDKIKEEIRKAMEHEHDQCDPDCIILLGGRV